MDKFCVKCGAELDETTGLCPKCDAKQKGREKTKKKRTNLKRRQKVCVFSLKIILFVIIAIGLIGILVHWNVVDFPSIKKFLNQNKMLNYVEDVERDIPETSLSGFAMDKSLEKNIITDTKEGIIFVNNEILVSINSSANKYRLERYISKIGGRIVGEIQELADYQILLDKEYTIRELQAMITEMSEQDWVVSANPNYCIKIDTQYIPNDKKWLRIWEDVSEGTNWGVEAIDIQEAWDYQANMNTRVNIGVIDGMFDVCHEDLIFAEMPLGNEMAKKKEDWDDHGTHTAGTIAATTNNKKGIAGISLNHNLYGVSYAGLSVGGYSTLQSIKIAFYYLIATKECSVINMSIGLDHITFEASRGGVLATNVLNNVSSGIEKFLKLLIDKDYQFLICKAAGNQNEIGGNVKYQYFRKDKTDSDYSYEYYCYQDYLKYLSKKTEDDDFKKYKNKKSEIESRLEGGKVDAKYDILGAITNAEVSKRIIIVGAAENLGTHREGGFLGIGSTKIHDGYRVAPYSQCGQCVDIIAPGTDIYSTIKNGYGEQSGTSMAAPHVSGVASLIFSVNSNIQAEDVKKIICSSTTGSYGEEKYGLLNARNAVEAVLNYTPDKTESIKDQLYGSWLQVNSDDPVLLTLNEDSTMQYYNSVSHESDYNSTFEWEDRLYLNLLNLTNSNVTSVPYKVEMNDEQTPIQMTLSQDDTQASVDTTALFGMDKIIEGTYEKISFTKEQLEIIKTSLGVPKNMKVIITQSSPYYWEAGQSWLIQVDIHDKNNRYLAGAAFYAKTMEMCKNIYMYTLDGAETINNEVLYAEILDMFYNNIQSGWADYQGMPSSYGDKFCYLFPAYYSDPFYIDKIGYCFIDLNGDRTDELLIGMDKEESTGDVFQNAIYDLYTYADGEILHLATSGERFIYQLCKDQTIYYWGTSGVDSAAYYHYQLSTDASELSILEGVYSEPGENWENVYWYHFTSEFYDSETGMVEGGTVITENEANTIRSTWPQKVDFPLTYFGEYQPVNKTED